jgi:multicomponent Na+:H+ antiporter subunit D
MIDHLPILQIVVPLLGAPLCALLRKRGWAWPFALGVAAVSLAISITMLRMVSSGDILSYAIGGWAPPYGIELRVDLLNALVLTLVTAIGTITIAASPKSLAKEIGEDRLPLVYSAMLLCFTGMLGMTITGDLFNVFVFLEISSLSTYTLIALGSDRRSLTASLHYLILGTIGATFILISIGLLYSTTGTLNMADMAARIPADSRTVQTAFAFFTVGIGLKMAFFPLHMWLPNAYTYAPSIVTAFLASTATKVSVYIFLRFIVSIYGHGFAFGVVLLQNALLPLSIVGILAMSVAAFYQSDIKRLLAYSSVAQIGYMILGICLGTADGFAASITHLLNHAMIKGCLFLAIAAVVYRIGSSRLEDLAGLGRRMPWTTFAWVLGGLSLIGVPATSGFVSKWALLQTALTQRHWIAALLILVGSLVAVAYVWKAIEVFYFRPLPNDAETIKEAPAGLLIAIWGLALANVYFGLRTEWTLGLATRAAEALIASAG